MITYRRMQVALLIQCVLLLVTSYFFIHTTSQEVTRLQINRAELLRKNVEVTLLQAREMRRIAEGPLFGKMKEIKPLHAALLAKIPSLASLKGQLTEINNNISWFTFGISASEPQIAQVNTSYNFLLDSYSELIDYLRYIDSGMDARKEVYHETAGKIRVVENQLASLQDKLDRLAP